MTSEMIERVTKALREELQKIGYGVGTINAGQLADALARAAIEAMREPTDDMIEATRFAVQAHSSARDADRALYRAMIDRALAGSTPPDLVGVPRAEE